MSNLGYSRSTSTMQTYGLSLQIELMSRLVISFKVNYLSLPYRRYWPITYPYNVFVSRYEIYLLGLLSS